MTATYKNIKRLCTLHNHTIENMCDSLGIDQAKISEDEIIAEETLGQIAGYFQVDMQTLICNENSSDAWKNQREALKKTMAKNIRHYMSENNVSASDICKALNIPPVTFSDWVHARIYPRMPKIEMLADYFGVTKNDLIEGPQINKSALEEGGGLTEEEQLLLDLFRRLPEELHQTFLIQLRALAEAQKQA